MEALTIVEAITKAIVAVIIGVVVEALTIVEAITKAIVEVITEAIVAVIIGVVVEALTIVERGIEKGREIEKGRGRGIEKGREITEAIVEVIIEVESNRMILNQN